MIGTIGLVSLRVLSIFVCLTIGAHIFSFLSKRRMSDKESRLFMVGLFLFALIASLSLIWLLVSENDSYAYVVEYTNRGLPIVYRIAAFWGGSAGSLLFWVLVLSMYGAIVAHTHHPDSERMLPIVNTIICVTLLFYVILLNFDANPFQRLPHPVSNGNGLSPLLQNPGMTVHPVNLYLGYIGFTIPYAYAMAGLILRKADATWLKVTRKWTLISWLFLSIGIIYGANWSYDELGWGGYWTWDPVENASILPWFTATAFMHCAIVEERKGMLRVWNIMLITITFLLTLFGTFLVRSGAIWSIHAFANGPMGAYYLVFIGVVLISSTVIIIWRFRTLLSNRHFESVVSRETGFVLNNLLFISIMIAILWGTIFPLVSPYFYGQQMVVSKAYYNGVVLPLAVVLLAFMGIGQYLSWRHDSLRHLLQQIIQPLFTAILISALITWMFWRMDRHIFYFPTIALLASVFAMIAVLKVVAKHFRGIAMKNWQKPKVRFSMERRRWYGGQIAHLSFAIIALGIIGSGSHHVDKQVTLGVGNQVEISDFKVTFLGLGTSNQQNGAEKNLYADLLVKRGGKTLGVMRPSATFYENGQAPITNVTLYSRPLRDFYVVLLGTGDDNQHAIIDFHVNPLVEWIWFGGYLLIAGTVISLWPESQKGRHSKDAFQEVGKC